MKDRSRRPLERALRVAVVLALAATSLSGCVGCAHTDHLAMSHRHSPSSEARIVVLPVGVPAAASLPAEEGRTLAALYATELLKSYEVLEYERFERFLEARELTLDGILSTGLDGETARELDLHGLLLSSVYEWDPGKAGFWFLKKMGRIGFQARLVDVNTGGVIWGVNRVVETPPAEPLSVGLSRIFADLADEMPTSLTPY